MTAIAVTIAGSDSSGGAGIQADLKTFSALGVYGASVIAALTAQNTRGVTGIFDVAPDFVTAQIDAVFSDLAVGAVKIGMLSRVPTIRAVADGLRRWRPPAVVLDPVMVATSGDVLLAADARAALVEALFPLATLVTPNLAEAATLTGEPKAESDAAMWRQAERLIGLGAGAVLMKGGHGAGEESVDLLLTADGARHRFSAPRHPTRNTHGTGCTLSSAIAAGLAKGLDLVTATEAAKAYLTAAIVAADGLAIGHGHGPVHHFHAMWPKRDG
jgi:hydroxymethylpyrimidine/phosphomethylpyrimidine kinase